MRRATRDRGEIIHAAGAGGLSPALKGGRPALVREPDPDRCGWEPFFAALEREGLVLAHDPEDPSATALVPAAEAGAWRPRGRGPLAALSHARRFLRALFR